MRHVPDFDETCKAILDAVMGELDAENCSVMLRDPVSGDLSICAARGKKRTEVFIIPNTLRMEIASNPGRELQVGF